MHVDWDNSHIYCVNIKFCCIWYVDKSPSWLTLTDNMLDWNFSIVEHMFDGKGACLMVRSQTRSKGGAKISQIHQDAKFLTA